MDKKKLLCIFSLVVIVVIVVVAFVLNHRSYKGVAKDFAKAVKSEDDMEKFVEKNFDARAYYVIEMMGKDSDLNKDDQAELKKYFNKEYRKAKKSDYEDSQEQLTEAMKHFVSDDKLKFKSANDPEEVEDFKLLKKVKVTFEDEDDKEVSYDFYFYKKKLVLIDSYEAKEVVAQSKATMSEQEKDVYNYAVKSYLGDSVKGTTVKMMIDSIMSSNSANIGEDGKFISVEIDGISGVDSTDLDSACKKANTYEGGDNTYDNVTAASKEMTIVKNKISSGKSYKLTAEYERGIIYKVLIEEE